MFTEKRYSKSVFKVDFSGIKPVDPQIVAKVEMTGGKPCLKINGRVEAPIFFFGNTEAKNHEPFVNEQIRMASRKGVHLHTVVVHFPVMPEGYKRNFDWIDKVLDYVLEADPDAKVLIRVPLYPHDVEWWNDNLHGDIMEFGDGSSSITWWEKFHPDDLMKYHDGSTSIPSVASEEWMSQTISALDAGIGYIANHPIYSSCVIGYHLTYGSSGEWFYMKYREKGYDHSEANRIGFTKWLREKYRSEDAVSKAWLRKIANIGTIEIPEIPNEFFGSRDNKVLLSDENRDVMDFYEYINDINELRIEQVSQFVKIKTNNKSLVMIFYGYNYELPDPKSGHGYLQELLECGFVDMLSSPISYQDRAEGGVMAYMAPVDTVQMHGVIWMVEDDTRTYRASNLDGNDSGFNPTIAEEWVTKEIHKRNFSSIIAHANGMWWMDLWGSGWLLDENIWENNRKLIDAYNSYIDLQKPFLPEAAFIISEKNAFYMNNPGKHQIDLIYKSNIDIYKSGLSVGYYTFDDAINGRLPGSVKLHIFLNAVHINEIQLDKIKNNLMKNGNTLLFNFAVGDADNEYSKDLLGMNLIPFDTNDYSPMYYVESGRGIDIIERFGEDGEISVAGKKESDYTMIFCSYPTVNAERLRKIARYCNIHVYCETDDFFVAGTDIVSIHAKVGGNKTIKLPFTAEITDFDTAEQTFSDTIEIQMAANTTAIYFYKKI